MTDADPRGPRVQLDRQRRLRFTMAAVEEIQRRFDVNIIAGEMFQATRTEDLTFLVWVGLKHAGETPDWNPSWWEKILATFGVVEPPELTQDVVAEWLDMRNLPDISKAILDALGQQKVDMDELDQALSDPTRARESETKESEADAKAESR